MSLSSCPKRMLFSSLLGIFSMSSDKGEKKIFHSSMDVPQDSPSPFAQSPRKNHGSKKKTAGEAIFLQISKFSTFLKNAYDIWASVPIARFQNLPSVVFPSGMERKSKYFFLIKTTGSVFSQKKTNNLNVF